MNDSTCLMKEEKKKLLELLAQKDESAKILCP